MRVLSSSVTERATFRTCRRRWDLDVNKRLQAKNQVAWPLIFGDCVHSGLEMYYRYDRKLSDALAGFTVQWEKENDLLKDAYGGMYDLGIGNEWYEYREKGEQMLTYYQMYDSQSKWFDEILDVNIEERAWIDILSTDGKKIPGIPWVLSGKIDLVVRRKDGIWIWDHKTAASAPATRALEVDDQLTAYCYIYWRLTGEVPRGAMYNVLLKDPPKPPRVLKDGSLSRDKSQRTTHDLYLQAINEMGLDPLDYQEMLDMLEEKSWKQFFIREGMHRHEEELYSFERRLFHEYSDMNAALEDEELLYPNPGQYTCMTCPYIPLCQSMEEQGDTEFLIENMYEKIPPRTLIPPEIADPSWEGV